MKRTPVWTGEHEVCVVVGHTRQPTIFLVATPAVGQDTDQPLVESDQASPPPGLGLPEGKPVVDGHNTASDRGRSGYQVHVGPPHCQRLSSSDPRQDVEKPEVVVPVAGGLAQEDLELSR
jgi:hypothetical protein